MLWVQFALKRQKGITLSSMGGPPPYETGNCSTPFIKGLIIWNRMAWVGGENLEYS